MIRPYGDADLEQVIDVWYRAARIAHAFLPDKVFVRERQQIAEEWLPVAETIVYVDGDQVVGFLALVGNEVGGIFVDPQRQGEGIGRALIDAARASRPFLELDVFEANAIGRRFYDAYGFRVVGRHDHEETGRRLLRLRLD